ncbi:MAG: chromosome partitioning protein, partial [Bdellovibrio sp. CG10_big_fil_rev_8_21_14_0_10_47_8]
QLPPEARIWQVNIDKLRPSAFQPRIYFEKAKLEELAVSIKQNGIIQPIVGRKTGSGAIEIIAGERRWRAAQLAGLHEVPVILKNMQDQATLEMAIIENIQREDLNPVEEAEAYQRLSQEFQMTQQQIAEKVGKDRATVANIMRLLGLPDLIRQMILKSEISSGHAKVLLSIADQKTQIDLAKKIVRQKMSVRQLEKMAAAAVSGGHKEDENVVAPESNVTQRLISGLAEELQKIMGTKVSIDYHQSKGKIAVHFYSDEELTQIVDRLKDGYGKR